MFTQKISMDCTKEQYEKYLKEELGKMGYKEVSTTCWNDEENKYFTNCFGDQIGEMGNINEEDTTTRFGNTYLGSFNAPLFLALAAMTDKEEGNYGELVVGIFSGVFYRIVSGDVIKPQYDHIRKATVKEIMAHLAPADRLNAEPEKPINKGSITFDIKLDTAGLEEQLDQFSKRFKAKIKEETLSAYLDKVIKDLEEMLGTDKVIPTQDTKPTYDELAYALRDTHNLYVEAIKASYGTYDITRLMGNERILSNLK